MTDFPTEPNALQTVRLIGLLGALLVAVLLIKMNLLGNGGYAMRLRLCDLKFQVLYLFLKVRHFCRVFPLKVRYFIAVRILLQGDAVAQERAAQRADDPTPQDANEVHLMPDAKAERRERKRPFAPADC